MVDPVNLTTLQESPLKGLLSRFRAFVASWFRPAVEAVDPPPSPAVRPAVGETFGTHYTLAGLLDNLDDYHDSLRQLRVRDPESFRFYCHIGGQILPRSVLFEVAESPVAKAMRPAFGMIHFLYDDADDANTIAPSLLYYRKFSARAFVEPTNDDLYEITMYYRDRRRGRRAFFVTFHVSYGDGTARLLREQHVVPQKLPRGGTIHHRQWQHPAVFREMLDDRRRTNQTKYAKTAPEDLALDLFRLLINATVNASDGLMVSAMKNGIVARFSVDMLRTPYFFRDREKTITTNGKTRKIFHIARTHKRRLADGREIYVKSHFRGERKFSWNGYDVTITMPGLHHAPLESFNAAAHEFDDNAPPPGYIDSAIAAKEIGAVVRH